MSGAQMHTPEPWAVEDHPNGCLFITAVGAPTGDIADLYGRSPGGKDLYRKGANGVAEANAARIVACVNYCAGTPNELLNCASDQAVRAGSDALAAERLALIAQRDRLLAENERLTAWLRRIEGGDNPCTDEQKLRQWAYEALTLGTTIAEYQR